jgi:uncharacterized protein
MLKNRKKLFLNMSDKSKVYFTNLKTESNEDNRINKILRILEQCKFDTVISKKDLTAVKIHFGERGNDTFIAPWYARPIVDEIKKVGGKPFLTDTNTLYSGARKNAVIHLNTAIKHGYVPSVAGAPVIIADGLTGRNYENVKIEKKHFQSVKIASDIYYANSMIVISHFKGHIMAGFGGAIKNLAMGCSPAEGKREQHSARPTVDKDLCVGCGECVAICPVDTIELIDGKSEIDSEKCIGCGECISHCPEKAIQLDWATEIPDFTERMTEYAYGAWKTKEKKILFINFIWDITPDCDCMSWSASPVVEDIGIVASFDPIAIDKASLDLVNQAHGLKNTHLKANFAPGEDKFKGINENTQGEIQLDYGESLGMGSKDYELIEI